MERTQKISEYRDRLDRTLASHNLVDEESVKNLVKNQLIRSSPSDAQEFSEEFVERRSNEVSTILDMLRSTSEYSSDLPKAHGIANRDWKLKHDNEVYRVMYREGREGTPYHTLLVEGYVDGPVDVCMCLSWESDLFKRWWPQFSFPPFKIITSTCLQKIRLGEQICLVRVKVAWPLSAREVILHYFELEYFEDDLVIVLLDTISDPRVVDKRTHGFTGDYIPDAKDMIRIDVVGGFVLQKVTSNRSYFRTIATMDMKLDFVPPSLINFVARQLIGNGFKLYQKTVASVAKGDEEFGKALEDPFYVRIREGLYHDKKLEKPMELEALESENSTTISLNGLATPDVEAKIIDETPVCDSHAVESSKAVTPSLGPIYPRDSHAIGISEVVTSSTSPRFSSEIKEEDVEEETYLKRDEEIMDHSSLNLAAGQCGKEKKVVIRPEVQHALSTLDNLISMVRKGRFGIHNWSGLGSSNQELPNLERIAREVGSTSSGDNSGTEVGVRTPKVDNMDKALAEAEKTSDVLHVRNNKQDVIIKEVKNNQIKPTSPIFNTTLSHGAQEDAWVSPENGQMNAPVFENMSKHIQEATVEVNGSHEKDVNGGDNLKKKKKHGMCCLYFYSNRT